METKFKAFMGNEEARLERDVQAAQDRSAADAAAREARRSQEWTAICRSREQQLALRAAKKDAAAREEREFVHAWKVRSTWLPAHVHAQLLMETSCRCGACHLDFCQRARRGLAAT